MVDYNNFDDMAESLGQDTGPQGSEGRLPTIKVNSDVIEKNGETVVNPGCFVLDYEGTKIYAKTVTFRPYINVYQYRLYNAANPKESISSILIKNFKEEAIDEAGGLRCGKLTKAEVESIPEDKRVDADNGARTYRVIYGTVSMNGVTEDGAKVKVHNYPAQFQLRGSNFMPFGEVLQALTKNRKLMYNFEFTVSLQRKKQGAVTYYVLQFDADMNNSIPFKEEDAAILGKFEELIKVVNKRVTDKYNKLQNAKAANASRKKAADELNDSLEFLTA